MKGLLEKIEKALREPQQILRRIKQDRELLVEIKEVLTNEEARREALANQPKKGGRRRLEVAELPEGGKD